MGAATGGQAAECSAGRKSGSGAADVWLDA